MIRLLLGLLVAGNLLLFLYGYLGLERQPQQPPLLSHRSDVGSIRLLAAHVGSREAMVDQAQPTARPAAEDERGILAEPAAEIPPPPVEEQAQAERPGEEAGPATAEPPAEALPRPGAAAETSGEPETVAASPGSEPPAPAEPAPAVHAPASYCGTLGPFRSRARARRFLRDLGTASGFEVRQRPTLVDASYWVLIPPRSSREEARALVARLREKGVEDLWLIPRGEMRNAISLGLYSRREAARAHAENLHDMGFEVEVRPKQKQVERYWLDFSGVSAEVLAQLKSRELPPGVSLAGEACDQPLPLTSG